MPKQILEFVGTVTVPATTQFVACEKFVVAKTPVEIDCLSDNFNKWFLGKVEEPATETILCYEELVEHSVDGQILAELGGEAETTLAQIYALIERQPNGEKGVLLTNGLANIFYPRDAKGELRALHVRWGVIGWLVYANSASLDGWLDGHRVFSRNPR